MDQALEKRIDAVEKKVSELSDKLETVLQKKDWRSTVGAFRDDPYYEEASRLGREYREQQTYEKGIAGS